MMKQSTSFAQVATNLLNVLQGYSKTIRLLLVMFVALSVSAEMWGADNLFNVTSYNSIPSGWTNSGVTTGSYFNFNTNNCSLTSPLYDPHTDLILTYKVATYGSGTNHPLTIQLLDENGNVKQTHTTGTPTSSTYISGTWSIGTVNYKFKIKFYLATAGKGVRLQTPKLVGNPATSTDPYTVTLNAGPGTCAASVTEASAGAGVTLPTPTLDCGDWEFAGWKTTSAVTTETTTEPTLIAAGAYSPTSDITLYAVYQRTEDGGGNSTPTSVTKEFSGANNADLKFTTGSSSNHLVNNTGYTAGDANVKFTIGTNNNNSYYDGSVVRFYAGSSMIITPLNGVTITRVEIVRSSSTSSNSGTISADNLTASNSNSTINTNVFTGSSTTAVTFKNSAQCRFTALNVTYTTSGGGSSTTYYHSTPDCGSTETSLCLVQKVVVH